MNSLRFALFKPSARVGLALQFGAIFAAAGVTLPFWPLWLGEKGFGAAAIGAILAAQSVGRAMAAPVWGVLADRTGERKRILVPLALATCVGAAGFYGVDGALATLALAFLAFGVFAPPSAMIDDLALAAAKRDGFDYGRVRLWGSVTFLLATLAVGYALDWLPPGAILPTTIALLAVSAGTATLLPDLRLPARARLSLAAIPAVLRAPGMGRFLLVVGLIQNSHFLYYGFSALDWRAAGIAPGTIGLLWAEGVVAEVLLFWFAGALSRRVSTKGFLVLAGGFATVRWIGMALTVDPLALVGLQALHAFSFGAAHLGAMAWLAERAPEGLSATAQTLYSALALGFGGAVGYGLAGLVYGAVGSAGYGFAAAMTLAALILLRRLGR